MKHTAILLCFFTVLAGPARASEQSPTTVEGVLRFMALIPACEKGLVPQCVRAGGWDRIADAKEVAVAISRTARTEEEADRMSVWTAFEGGMRKMALGDGGKSKGVVQLQNVPDEVAYDPAAALRAWQQLSDASACADNPPDERMAWAWGGCAWKVSRAGARHREEVRRAVRARIDAEDARRAAADSL